MKNKIVLAAGIVRDLKFLNKEIYDLYLYFLDHRYINYEILDSCTLDDGSIIVRIVQQYNDVDLIDLT